MNMTLTLRLDEDTARRLVRFGAEHGMSLDDAVLNVLRKSLATPVLAEAQSLLPEEIVSAHDMLAWADGEAPQHEVDAHSVIGCAKRFPLGAAFANTDEAIAFLREGEK